MPSTTPLPVAGGGAESARTIGEAIQITSPAILRQIEAVSATGSGPAARDLLDQLSSPAGNAQAPLSHNDFIYPLPNYYISSSHNTYLWVMDLSDSVRPKLTYVGPEINYQATQAQMGTQMW